MSILSDKFKRLPEDVNLIHRLFERNFESVNSVAETANLVQTVDVNGVVESISYRSLNLLSNVIARRLSSHCRVVPDFDKQLNNEQQEHHVEPMKTMCVAIDVEPSIGLIAGLLAIIKLGLAYVPIDTKSTAVNRTTYILQKVEPVCIVADESSAICLEAGSMFPHRCAVVNIKQLMEGINVEDSIENSSDLTDHEMVNPQSEMLAILFTSGSTGVPKGIGITHHVAINRVYWQLSEFPFQPNDVGCLKTSLLFVDSIPQIFATMAAMIPLIVVGKRVVSDVVRFVDCLQQHRITHIYLVPSLLSGILQSIELTRQKENRLSELRVWITSGEPLSSILAQKFFAVFPSGKSLYNYYGSTEMSDVTVEEFLTSDDVTEKSVDGILSIGRPIFNTAIYLVDDEFHLVPTGEFGEICVSGMNIHEEGVYVVRTVEARCFLHNPFVDKLEELVGTRVAGHLALYRTGDYGRIVKDRLIYQGRRDQQVKVQGQRVNMVEVEHVIAQCPVVHQVVILHHVINEVVSVLVAYFTTIVENNGDLRAIESDIRHRCMTSLPECMQPKLVHVDEIPLQSHTGKIDRMALKTLYADMLSKMSAKEMNAKEMSAPI